MYVFAEIEHQVETRRVMVVKCVILRAMCELFGVVLLFSAEVVDLVIVAVIIVEESLDIGH